MTSNRTPYYLQHTDNFLLDIAVQLLNENKATESVKHTIQNYHVVHYHSKLNEEQLDRLIELADFMRL